MLPASPSSSSLTSPVLPPSTPLLPKQPEDTEPTGLFGPAVDDDPDDGIDPEDGTAGSSAIPLAPTSSFRIKEKPEEEPSGSPRDLAGPLARGKVAGFPYQPLVDTDEVLALEKSETYLCCLKIFPQSAFEKCFAKIAKKCPDIRKIIKEDSATMHKQMIAWVIRCGLTGALWTAGYTIGAMLDKADSSTAAQSRLAWFCASLGQGLAEMLCVTFIGYYLSDPKMTFKSNSNGAGLKQNLMEGAFWGASCLTGGTLWQPSVNTLCSPKDLSKAMPLCMVKVGASTGATFGVTLACIKVLVSISEKFCKKEPGYFRPFSASATISDSVLFGLIVVGTADAFFVMTSTDSPFNHKPYSMSDEFELMPVLTQMGLSAASTMLGGLAAYVIRGGLRSMIGLLEGDLMNALRDYCRDLSCNSHCTIL